jgi:hypothetical protein
MVLGGPFIPYLIIVFALLPVVLNMHRLEVSGAAYLIARAAGQMKGDRRFWGQIDPFWGALRYNLRSL